MTSAETDRSIDERLAGAGLPALPRRCWLEIDEGALADNLHLIRRLVGPNVEISAVIKADAYGHGIEAAARAFTRAGADRLCVAALDEALHLRRIGVASPLLVLFAVPVERVAEAARAGLEIVIAEEEGGSRLLEAWRDARRTDALGELRIHVEVETGLQRAGLPASRVADFALRASSVEGLRLHGLWSHLASSDDVAVSAEQVAMFEEASRSFEGARLPLPRRHLAATGGILAGSAPLYEGVRPGLALYGLVPDGFPVTAPARAVAGELRPAMSLKCRPLRVEEVGAGTGVGYGGLWRAARPSRIATLPVGYGDGWSRAYAAGAEALVRGRRVPLIGSVAMDAVMADVTDVAGTGVEDEFVLLGEQGEERITAQDLARIRTTIPWEVVTGMAQRVPRVYHSRAVLQGVRTLAGEVRGGAPSDAGA